MTNATRYPTALIVIHWLTFLVLIGVYVCIEGREYFPRGSVEREAMKAWHFTLGLSVFALVWLRLLLRALHVTPAIEPPLPRWQHVLSKAVHGVLYLVMIAMPVGGWLILSGEAKPIPFFGFELPALIGPDKALAHSIEKVHKTVGSIALYLIGLHAVAALFHHYISHDNTLTRMLPGGKPR